MISLGKGGIFNVSAISQAIYNLPLKFQALVLAAGKDTPHGRWYKIQFGDQAINIKSAVDLEVGARYDLKKLSPNQLQLLGKSEGAPGTEEAPAVKATELLSFDRTTSEKLPENLTLDSLPQLLQQLVISDTENQKKINFSFERNQLFFDFSFDGFSQPLSGAIFQGREGDPNSKNKVLLAFDDADWQWFSQKTLRDRQTFLKELKEFLGELSIGELQFISPRQLATLRRGVDLRQ